MTLLVVVSSPPGAGGSTVAEYIAGTLLPGSVHINKDEISDRYTGLRDSPEYAAVRGHIYDEVGERLHAYLSGGISVVLSSAFRKQITSNPWIRDNLEFVCALYSAELRIVQLTIREDELKRRVEARGLPRDLEMLADWDERIIREPVEFHVPHMNVLKIDAMKPVESYERDLRSFLTPRMNFDGRAAGIGGAPVAEGEKAYKRKLQIASS
ncbi:AAA family ATPase [Candidatus Woesearchaeota archaeon]|nr:AAA family ATPase [Candidatus Woesearchaeota archaeon]